MPQRYTPAPHTKRKPSRAARAKRRRRRFGIPMPPTSPTTCATPSTPSSHDDESLQPQAIQTLCDLLPTLRPPDVQDASFPVTPTVQMNALHTLASLSQCAANSGQTPLIEMATQFDMHSCSKSHTDMMQCEEKSVSGSSTESHDTTTPLKHQASYHTYSTLDTCATAPLHPAIQPFRQTVLSSKALCPCEFSFPISAIPPSSLHEK